MLSRKNIFTVTALLLTGAAPLFAGGPVYREAAAPWSAEQAVKLPPALTPDFLKGVEKDFGSGAAAELSVKKEKVEGLLKRFKICGLNAEDLKSADKYLTPDFKAQVRYFAVQGCAAIKEAAAGHGPAAPQSASLSGLEGLSASGSISTYEGSARFFDGASGKGQAAGPVAAGTSASSARPAAVQAAAAKQLSSKVPALAAEAARLESRKPERPAKLGEDGMVHQAQAFWGAMTKENWASFKKADNASDRAKALLKAGVAVTFNGLLMYSNLAAVETDAARLGWDHGHGAGGGTMASDSAKLAFNSAVFILALAPIPMLKVAKAALAGEAWAIALVAAMGAGTVNHYVVHVAD